MSQHDIYDNFSSRSEKIVVILRASRRIHLLIPLDTATSCSMTFRLLSFRAWIAGSID